MDDNNWRIPNEEEKKHILSWINKYKNDFCVPALCFSFGMLILFSILLFVFREIEYLIVIAIPIIHMCIISMIVLFAWKELKKLVSEGNYMITDAKVIDFTLRGRLIKVSYFENNEHKSKELTRFFRYINTGLKGYIVNLTYTKSKKIISLIGNILFIPEYKVTKKYKNKNTVI